MIPFSDAHIHLDFIQDGGELALRTAQREEYLFANTVSPYGYMKLQMHYPGNPWVLPGLGFHPWWIAAGVLRPADLELLEMLAPQTAYVGEVGLDFMGARKACAEDQVDAFDRIIEACTKPLVCATATAEHQRIISIHSVKAATAALDVLERWNATADNACVFHWFTGSSDELQRAIKLGCYFSVGERMLNSKKGRAYVDAIPADRLLIETDAPGTIEPMPWDSVTSSSDAPVPDPRLVALSPEDWEARLTRTRSLVDEVYALKKR